MIKCQVCDKLLTGKQKIYCSNKCKCKTTNNKFQNYEAQKDRAKSRKLELIKLKGGRCSRCGYKKNYSALVFHHTIPSDKLFNVDSRKCSNAKWEELLSEANKCELLCHNCHSEHHNPDCLL